MVSKAVIRGAALVLFCDVGRLLGRARDLQRRGAVAQQRRDLKTLLRRPDVLVVEQRDLPHVVGHQLGGVAEDRLTANNRRLCG